MAADEGRKGWSLAPKLEELIVSIEPQSLGFNAAGTRTWESEYEQVKYEEPVSFSSPGHSPQRWKQNSDG
jgi:hypothetical protein